ncbi:hypothetical protein [Fulvivirga kasyanovii]|uniref:Uncharacterized protein n=1 Tax=Fulvivirga kasyanovii TaxID=396812 RepID=A0ABW9RK83_9BACT|nr:hypothetical protein [Fulvivirga kasyanovii]MTI24497.1 hypothetical protein [Fulvivirga kasyanovii]
MSFRLLLAGAMMVFIIGVNTPEVQAQEKSRYEKMQEKRNKSNRRLKRRGDKGKSNKRKLRATKFKVRSKQGERAFRGDITGRKFQSKRSTRPKWGARIAKPNPYAGRKRTSEASRAKAFKQTPRYSSRDREKAWKGNAGRASSGSIRTTFTGKRSYQQVKGSGRSITRDPERPRRVRRVTPRSASGAYRVRKREKPYAIRERSKWEKAFQGDITGRRFRTKRTTDRPSVQRPRDVKYTSKGRRGDKAYRGKIQAGYKSISRTKEKAWKKDISGNKLRIRTSGQPKFNDSHFQTYPKGKRKGDKAYRGKLKGGGYKSISSRKERAGRRSPSTRPPGEGTQRAWKFQGNIKSGKPLKGGGSVSGKRWNNNGRAVQGRGPREQDNRVARFQGNVKGGRRLKGGGSISGKRWNNNGRSIQGRGPREQDNRVARFQGNVKKGRPLKGGGSISGKRWNNNGRAVQGRGPREQDNRVARFQGNIKGGKPLKGGGSISGKRWNNKGKAVQGRGPREQDNRVARFQGNIKKGRPLKGGGSISGKLWNNKGKAIRGRDPREQDNRVARFQGNIKGGKPLKGGGSISRAGWNNKGKAVQGREPRDQDDKIAKFQGNIRQYMLEKGPDDAQKYKGNLSRAYLREKGPNDDHKYRGNIKQFHYKKNPNSAEEALKIKPPDEIYFRKKPYQGNIKVTSKRKRSKSAAEEALVTKPPGKGTARGMEYQGRLKMPNYKKNPKGADDALKGIGPSRASIQAGNYQGNIKMRKKRVEDRHPDFKYLSSKSNGKAEKDKTFSFKLLWAKFFKKNENQPDNLKQKERKPRYDKREEDIWYD